ESEDLAGDLFRLINDEDREITLESQVFSSFFLSALDDTMENPTGNDVSDVDNVYYKTDERRAANDYDCVVDNTSLSRAFSPKRSYPSSDSSYSMSKAETPKNLRPKKVKVSPPNSIDKRNFPFNTDNRTTSLAVPKISVLFDFRYNLFILEYNRCLNTEKKFLNFIPDFATIREPPCGVNLGTIEPINYPANYMIDTRSSVNNMEINVTRKETHYICQAPRIVDITRFIYTTPFVIINVENSPSLMTNLPDPLNIGEYE
ncbi:unnamed protein product, partial [Didymodactylos carnosus]